MKKYIRNKTDRTVTLCHSFSFYLFRGCHIIYIWPSTRHGTVYINICIFICICICLDSWIAGCFRPAACHVHIHFQPEGMIIHGGPAVAYLARLTMMPFGGWAGAWKPRPLWQSPSQAKGQTLENIWTYKGHLPEKPANTYKNKMMAYIAVFHQESQWLWMAMVWMELLREGHSQRGDLLVSCSEAEFIRIAVCSTWLWLKEGWKLGITWSCMSCLVWNHTIEYVILSQNQFSIVELI